MSPGPSSSSSRLQCMFLRSEPLKVSSFIDVNDTLVLPYLDQPSHVLLLWSKVVLREDLPFLSQDLCLATPGFREFLL